jgi:hypothetical protein
MLQSNNTVRMDAPNNTQGCEAPADQLTTSTDNPQIPSPSTLPRTEERRQSSNLLTRLKRRKLIVIIC